MSTNEPVFLRFDELVIKPETVVQINELFAQLSSNPVTLDIEDLRRVYKDERFKVYVAMCENVIVGIGTVSLVVKLGRNSCEIQDVVVHDKYRGMKIGRTLLDGLILIAREEFGVKQIDLTSKPERIVANALYIKSGFVPRDTNFYRLTF